MAMLRNLEICFPLDYCVSATGSRPLRPNKCYPASVLAGVEQAGFGTAEFLGCSQPDPS